MEWISIISAVVASCSAAISWILLLEQRRLSKYQSSYSIITQVEKLIYDDPKLLKLHNITEEELEECKINHKELAYILLSFDSAQVYYLLEKKKNLVLSNYRKNFLNNEKVRNAWKNIIKDKMILESKFSKLVDNYYREKEKKEAKKIAEKMSEKNVPGGNHGPF